MKQFKVMSDVAKKKNFFMTKEDVLVCSVNATELPQFQDFELEVHADFGINLDKCYAATLEQPSENDFHFEYVSFIVTYCDQPVDFNSLPQDIRTEIMLAVTQPDSQIEADLLADAMDCLAS